MSKTTATALGVATGELERYERLVGLFPDEPFWLELRDKWAGIVANIWAFIDNSQE